VTGKWIKKGKICKVNNKRGEKRRQKRLRNTYRRITVERKLSVKGEKVDFSDWCSVCGPGQI
jgi:hypothetical protein